MYTIRITCYTCLPGHVMGQVPWHVTGKVPVWALNHAHPTRIPIRFVAISGENPSKHVTRPTNDAVLGVPQRGGCKTRMVVVW